MFLNLIKVFPFVRVIVPCDPTVDDVLFHICMLSISVSKLTFLSSLYCIYV